MKKINFLQAFLIFLLILSVGIGSGYLILYYLAPQTQIGQLVARVLILLVASIGIGLVCRLTIPARMWFLKICFGAIGSLLSILSLDWFFSTTYALLHDRTFNIEWWSVGEYTQIGCLLCATIFIAIIGKKKPISVQREVSNPEPKKIVQKRKSATSPVRSAVKKKTKQNAVSLSALAKKKLVKKTTRPKKVAAKPILKNAASAIKVKATGKTSLKKKKATTTRTRSRNNNVKLTGTEDHRCPYCLEEVRKNDPRGIVICPDCGTWHHRDCWEITGSCQIAHKHEL
jgi:ribosomal protein L37AE/L43A